MAAPARRAQPSTHPTVYAGLALAAVGLLVATYAYTGARIYDATYALVALGGGALAIVGILTAAWGRAVMAARAQRRGRAAPREAPADTPPTVAAPPDKAEKRRFALPKLPRRAPRDETAAPRQLFAFRRRAEPPPPAPEPEAASAAAAPSPEEAPPAAPEPAPVEVPVVSAAPVLERVTMRCPRCAATFTAEGVRPFLATCPSCQLTAEV